MTEKKIVKNFYTLKILQVLELSWNLRKQTVEKNFQNSLRQNSITKISQPMTNHVVKNISPKKMPRRIGRLKITKIWDYENIANYENEIRGIGLDDSHVVTERLNISSILEIVRTTNHRRRRMRYADVSRAAFQNMKNRPSLYLVYFLFILEIFSLNNT